MFLLLLFASIMNVFHSCSGENFLLRAYYPGDIIIGGLFPVHLTTNRSTTPGPLNCTNYDIEVFLHTQVMISAIREINQRTPRLLPNLTLGYDIYDTCGDVNFAIVAALQLLKNQSEPNSCSPETLQSTLPDPKTKAVIGERFSEVSVAVARVVALSSLPQISYASTSKLLSNKLKFPTFLRTISSDEYQTKAIAELVAQFKWKTVAIVGSDDEYGTYGSDSLIQLFLEKEICVEFSTILSGDFSQNNSQTRDHLSELVKNINQSFSEAIILFSKGANVNIIMDAAIKYNLNRTWIASDAWATSTTVAEMPGIKLAGQVFGFTSKRSEVPGFKDYVISMFDGTSNAFLQNYLSYYKLCSEENRDKNCTLTKSQDGSTPCLHPSCLVNYIDQDQSYNTYLAVQVIVEALRHLLKCDNQQCERSPNFTASELLMEIQKVNFTVNTTHLFFDNNGDPSIGYDILYWNMTDSTQIITIGEYWPDRNISILHNLVSDENVTIYNCSKTCQPGQELKSRGKNCCLNCVPCADGEFSPGDGKTCETCSQNKYSSPQRDMCFDKTYEFLNWLDPFSIILISLGVLGIIVTIVFAILFTIYHTTPIVKAVGGYLCFLELFSLLICFCLTFSFMGKPTGVSCMIGLPIFGMAFSLCIACILANLLQILVGFRFDLKTGSWIKNLNQPVAVVAIVSGIQLALCGPWLYYYPPYPQEEILSKTILVECEKGSTAYFIAMIGYNALLAFICFLFAFKGKQLPDLYKNASRVAISMLLFLIIWILFIQIYINLFGKYKPAIESAAVLISSYSILGCHLAPKCYIMVFKKEINNENTIAEYIRKHYEQKGMAMVRS